MLTIPVQGSATVVTLDPVMGYFLYEFLKRFPCAVSLSSVSDRQDEAGRTLLSLNINCDIPLSVGPGEAPDEAPDGVHKEEAPLSVCFKDSVIGKLMCSPTC